MSTLGKSLHLEPVVKDNETYLCIGLIGTGTQGDVYLYEEPRRKKRLALKTSKNDGKAAIFDQSLNKETYFLRHSHRHNCRHLPKFKGDGYMNDRNYLLLEYIDYGIEEYLDSDDIPNQISLKDVCLQMLNALRELHSAGILHQDVKPDNYRISKDHVVKIIDFGLSIELTKGSLKHKPLGRFGF